MHPGPLVTDNGFWDTFRTVYPLLGLLYPDLLGEVVQGWLNAFKEGGWLPGWASPGYRESMVRAERSLWKCCGGSILSI